ncbi:DUF3656 domain-containing protein [Peptoniphilus sp. MSJ-1]|uniref:DUF3656 domain-containing protein n=1 Tax=Peptoniphilus ovalis TaxID=2841503 RepID=A0ABS6FLT4_9FIRM|nr:DUF3656 domain-containing protein [Peptoniphilus ovalis]MBU5670140.1 DUF3656 domain-containing protein [Peptoniphilus ovalis]
MTKNNYEVLAPAGDMAALRAAVSAGADAVYLGAWEFSARAKAKNFTLEDLKEAIHYCHLRDVKIYVTVNILVADFELKRALNLVKDLYEVGVDALILQDLGLAREIRKNYPDFEIHASTQMAINNYYGAKFLKELGFSRVVLARETPLFEIEKISTLDVEIETFIHGALCVSYSGECLMSSMIGGKSGNRGECAQACRKAYDIYDFSGNKIADKKYYLSPKDLNTLEDVGKIIDAGGYSLKIEGRMKNPEYVYQVVRSYRKALENNLTLKDKEDTTQVFNRGFTKGLFNGDFGRNFTSFDRPDNRGVEIGKVVSAKKDVIVRFNEDIYPGDGLEFLGDRGNFGFKSEEFYKKDRDYKLNLNKKPLENSNINRTYSIKLYEKIDEKLKDYEFKKDIDIKVEIEVGKFPKIFAKTEDFDSIFELEEEVQEAKNAPLSKEKAEENISKLGDSIFEIRNLEIDIKGNAFMPVSSINKLRREVVENLERKILKSRLNRNEKSYVEREYKSKEKKLASRIKVFFTNLEDLKNTDLNEVDEIILRVKDLEKYKKLNLNKNVSIYLDKFYSYKELENLRNYILKNDFVKGIWANNLSEIEIFNNDDFEINADIGLNVFNSETVEFYNNEGLHSITLSPELNSRQIDEIIKNTDANLNIVSYGRIPVMTMKHCPYSVIKGCVDERDCPNCEHKNYLIRDAKSVDFEVLRHNTFTEIFNSYPILLDGYVNKIRNENINLVILADEFTDEIIDLYLSFSEDKYKKIRRKLENKYSGVTKGHINRGIISG